MPGDLDFSVKAGEDAANSADKKKTKKEMPKASSLVSVLEQAMHASDDALLEKALVHQMEVHTQRIQRTRRATFTFTIAHTHARTQHTRARARARTRTRDTHAHAHATRAFKHA